MLREGAIRARERARFCEENPSDNGRENPGKVRGRVAPVRGKGYMEGDGTVQIGWSVLLREPCQTCYPPPESHEKKTCFQAIMVTTST